MHFNKPFGDIKVGFDQLGLFSFDFMTFLCYRGLTSKDPMDLMVATLGRFLFMDVKVCEVSSV